MATFYVELQHTNFEFDRVAYPNGDVVHYSDYEEALIVAACEISDQVEIARVVDVDTDRSVSVFQRINGVVQRVDIPQQK